jgi:hypothetical protein
MAPSLQTISDAVVFGRESTLLLILDLVRAFLVLILTLLRGGVLILSRVLTLIGILVLV